MYRSWKSSFSLNCKRETKIFTVWKCRSVCRQPSLCWIHSWAVVAHDLNDAQQYSATTEVESTKAQKLECHCSTVQWHYIFESLWILLLLWHCIVGHYLNMSFNLMMSVYWNFSLLVWYSMYIIWIYVVSSLGTVVSEGS